MDFQESLIRSLVERLSGSLPRMALALLVLLAGWLVAAALRRGLKRLMEGSGLDALLERLGDIELVRRSGLSLQVSSFVSATAYYTVLLVFVVVATDILGIAAVTNMVRDLIDYLPSLFSALLLFVVGVLLADALRGLLLTALKSLGVTSASFLSSGVFYLLFVSIAVSALAQAKINTSFMASNLTVLIGAGALAFAIGYGLASRDLVANYLGGYYNKGKVHPGDEVQIGGVRGKVVVIDSTSLILQTEDRAILVPLSRLASEHVEIFYPEGRRDQLLASGDPTNIHS
jgi:small-conductance mechanosensitive channel